MLVERRVRYLGVIHIAGFRSPTRGVSGAHDHQNAHKLRLHMRGHTKSLKF